MWSQKKNSFVPFPLSRTNNETFFTHTHTHEMNVENNKATWLMDWLIYLDMDYSDQADVERLHCCVVLLVVSKHNKVM